MKVLSTTKKDCSSETVSSFERHWEDRAHFSLSRHRLDTRNGFRVLFSHFEGVICKAKDKGVNTDFLS